MHKPTVIKRLAMLLFVIFACFNGALALQAFLYERMGLKTLGQESIAIIYCSYFLSNFFARSIVGAFKEVKTSLFTGALFYAFSMFAGTLTYYCYDYEDFEGMCSKTSVRLMNYMAAGAVGTFGYTLLWNSQYLFIDKITVKREKRGMFSIFYAIYQFNYVAGNMMNFIFFSLDLKSVYYFLASFTLILVASSLFVAILPDIKNYDPHEDPESDNYNILSGSKLSVLIERSARWAASHTAETPKTDHAICNRRSSRLSARWRGTKA